MLKYHQIGDKMLQILNEIKSQLVELGLGVIGILSAILTLIPKNTWLGEKMEWFGQILGNLANWFKK